MTIADEISFTQRIISEMSKISLTTINRYVSGHAIHAIDTPGKKLKRYSIENTRNILQETFSRKLVPTKQIQVFYNFKGGTGKTNLCYQLSTHLAFMGFRVLAIDCDPQAHLTSSLGIDDMSKCTMFDVLIQKMPISRAIVNIWPGLDLIPSNLSLTRADVHLNEETNRERLMEKVLTPLKASYDFIFIDTNPTISILNRNAKYAADRLNVVCETQPYSLKGLEMLVNEIEQFSQAMERPIEYGIIANKYESKTATAQEMLGVLRSDYKEHVMESIVRRCEDLNISVKKMVPICALGNKSSVAFEDIVDLLQEIIKVSTETKQKQLLSEKEASIAA